jgi:hypothetical protein
MLRMDRSLSSRLWAMWDDQDLVAVVVDNTGAAALLRRLQAPAPPHPPLPGALASAGARPSTHAAWPKGNTGVRLAATHGHVPAVSCVTLDRALP